MIKKNIKTLTGIRFFAALHVVLFHNFFLLGSGLSRNTPDVVKNFLKRGEAAVSFFFILSGFILIHVYREKLSTNFDKKKYLLARFAKIYPLYILAFVLDLPRVLSYFFDQYESSTALFKTAVSAFSYIFAVQSWIPRLTTVWNSPAWSISCEAFFYFSLIFLLKPLLQIRRKAAFLLFLYLIPLALYFFTVSFWPTIESSPAFMTFWRSFPLLRLFEFLIGVIIYEMTMQNHPICNFIRRKSNIFFWGAILTSILIAMINFDLPEKVYNGIALAPFFAMIIIASSDDRVWGVKILSHSMVQLLGASSYALYITHQPLVYYVTKIFESSNNSVFLGSLYLLIAVLSSLFLYKFFEVPLQIKLKTMGMKILNQEDK